MEARFIDCCCTFCRKDDTGLTCPYIKHFGVWHDVSLRRTKFDHNGNRTKKSDRAPGGIRCQQCRGTGRNTRHTRTRARTLTRTQTRQRAHTNIHARARTYFSGYQDVAKNLPKKKLGRVMLICNSCDGGWHLSCLNPRLSALVKTKTWFCHNCTEPCDNCGQTDTHDDATKRLLRCNDCRTFVHMHCLPTPLKKEPAGARRIACNYSNLTVHVHVMRVPNVRNVEMRGVSVKAPYYPASGSTASLREMWRRCQYGRR